jgi:hypothetical protein
MDGSKPATIEGFPYVAGRCPNCGGNSLFLGSGGHITCSRLDCSNPAAVDDQLHAQPLRPVVSSGAHSASERPDIYELRELGVRVLDDDQCCELGCSGGACESCPCCCAGWCVTGVDGLPDPVNDAENYAIWLEVAAEHNPTAARLAAVAADLERTEGDLAVAVREATRARQTVASLFAAEVVAAMDRG